VRVLAALAVTTILWAFAGIRAGLEAYRPGPYPFSVRLRRPRRVRRAHAHEAAGAAGPPDRLPRWPSRLHAVPGRAQLRGGPGQRRGREHPDQHGTIFTALLAVAVLEERLRALGWVGTGVSLCGPDLARRRRGLQPRTEGVPDPAGSPLDGRLLRASDALPREVLGARLHCVRDLGRRR